MKFTAVIDYSEPTSSNMLFTEDSLTRAFSEVHFMEQCSKGEVPVYLDLGRGERMIIGMASAKLEYPNVSINAEICDTADSIKMFKKTMKNKNAGCVLTTLGTRYYDRERDCTVTGSLTCTGVKVVPNVGVPCLMNCIEDNITTGEDETELAVVVNDTNSSADTVTCECDNADCVTDTNN